jgi:hypothetical protein
VCASVMDRRLFTWMDLWSSIETRCEEQNTWIGETERDQAKSGAMSRIGRHPSLKSSLVTTTPCRRLLTVVKFCNAETSGSLGRCLGPSGSSTFPSLPTTSPSVLIGAASFASRPILSASSSSANPGVGAFIISSSSIATVATVGPSEVISSLTSVVATTSLWACFPAWASSAGVNRLRGYPLMNNGHSYWWTCCGRCGQSAG